jgi:hypothetical protein
VRRCEPTRLCRARPLTIGHSWAGGANQYLTTRITPNKPNAADGDTLFDCAGDSAFERIRVATTGRRTSSHPRDDLRHGLRMVQKLPHASGQALGCRPHSGDHAVARSAHLDVLQAASAIPRRARTYDDGGRADEHSASIVGAHKRPNVS